MKSSSSIARPESSPPPYERWWRCLFNESEDAQLVYASDGSVREANRTAMRLLGLAGREEPPPNLHQMLTSSAAARVAALLQQQVGSQVTLPAVAIMVEGQISLLADLQITPLGQGFSLVTIRDATRRWRMESHVQRLITAMDATPDVVFLTDVDFRLVFVNPSFLRDTGYSIEEALGRPANFFRAAGQEELWETCRQRVQAGKDWQGEMVNVRGDGSTFLAAVSMAPIFDRKGAFIGCVSFERDITQVRRVQTELQRESAFVRSIINSLDAALYATDRQFRLLHFNDGWKRLPAEHGGLRWERPPRLGDQLLDFVPDAGRRNELRRLFLEVLQSGDLRELRFNDTAGRHWQVRVTPWTMQGKIEGLLYMAADQTNLYQLQEQLAQAQKMEIIGALAAGVAHDFNNLLQVIRAELAELMQQADEARRPALWRMDEAAGQAADIIHQLLSISRATTDAGEVLDFNQALQEAANLFQRGARRQIECRLQPAACRLPVRLSRARAHQLLLNLCVNAQDAMADGGQLTLSNAVVRLNPEQASRVAGAAAPEWLRCTVRDTGCGIAAEHLPRIFEPFFTTKTAARGTGLGLAIVHNIVTQAGGFVEVESVVGQGTAFHIYLPLEPGADLTAPQAPALAGSAGGRILVVDDDQLMGEAVRTVFESAGFRVWVARHGEEALARLAQTEVDVLFTDFHLGGMDGVQLMHRALERQPRLRCVLATGHLPEEELRRLRQQSGVMVLQKPFSLQQAAAQIAALLAGPPPGSPAKDVPPR